jgi:hypothetical protein
MRFVRYMLLMVVSVIAPLFGANVFAQSADTEVLKSKVDKLEEELTELKDMLKQQIQRDMEKEKEITSLKEKDAQKEKEIASLREVDTKKEKEMASLKEEVQKKEVVAGAEAPGEESSLASKSKMSPIYAKPFLKRFGRNTYLGGYMDFQFRATEDDKGDHGFAVDRFIPFIYADVSDRVKVASEIEFENGGVSDESKGEAKLEFATIDYLITDWINFRGGFILTPLGKYNLIHDAPLQDLTDRPLVDQFIIPTTITDAGMGFFGSLYPSELSKLDYEIYATNGVFRGLDADHTSHFGLDEGIRETRGGFVDLDNYNESPAVVGRVAFSPFIGLEFGGSVYTSRYDQKNNNQLTIPALDFAYQRGPFELVGEGAYAFIETDNFARSAVDEDGNPAGIADSMWGYYVEGRYHFMPSCLKSWAPKFFTDNSTFTGVLRWDQVQTSAIEATGRENWLRNRVTPGLNYRYTEDTVFKLDYQINMEEKDLSNTANNAFLFSVATYF